MDVPVYVCVVFLITVILHSDFFAGKRIIPLATKSYNSSINYNRQKAKCYILCTIFYIFIQMCYILPVYE